jgi:anti-sigma B factor antagonist
MTNKRGTNVECGPHYVSPEVDAAVDDLLSLAYRREGPDVIVEVRGELDLATGRDLERALSDLIDDQGCGTILLDLRGLDFIGSTGLSLLLKAQAHAQSLGREIILVRLSPAARRAIELGGLLSTLNIRDDGSTSPVNA